LADVLGGISSATAQAAGAGQAGPRARCRRGDRDHAGPSVTRSTARPLFAPPDRGGPLPGLRRHRRESQARSPRSARTATAPDSSQRTSAASGFSSPARPAGAGGSWWRTRALRAAASGRAMSSRNHPGPRIPAGGRGTGSGSGFPARAAPGEPWRQGRGDLYVRVHVKPHEVFGRERGQPSTVTVPVTITELALGGGQSSVPTHRGPRGHRARQAEARRTGTVIRVPGRGVPQEGRDARRPARDPRGDGAARPSVARPSRPLRTCGSPRRARTRARNCSAGHGRSN